MSTATRKPGSDPVAAAKARLRRRNTLLVLLLPVLIAVWIPVLRGKPSPSAPPSPPPTVSPATGPAAAGEVQATTPAGAVVAATADITHRLQQLITPFTPRWSLADGDPFAVDGTPVGAPAPAAPATETAPTLTIVHDPHFVPSAVLISPNQPPLAIIDGRCRQVGDEIQGYRIVRIEERRVVFQQDGNSFAVPIPEPTLGQEQAR